LGGPLSKLCVTPPFSINFQCQIENQVSDYRLLGASSSNSQIGVQFSNLCPFSNSQIGVQFSILSFFKFSNRHPILKSMSFFKFSNWRPILKSMAVSHFLKFTSRMYALTLSLTLINKSAIDLNIWKGHRFENTIELNRDLR